MTQTPLLEEIREMQSSCLDDEETKPNMEIINDFSVRDFLQAKRRTLKRRLNLNMLFVLAVLLIILCSAMYLR
jgi:uncharacterized membrane protein